MARWMKVMTNPSDRPAPSRTARTTGAFALLLIATAFLAVGCGGGASGDPGGGDTHGGGTAAKDPAVVACENMRDEKPVVDGINDTDPSPEDIQRIRQAFQESQFSDLRDSGLAIVDLMQEGVLKDLTTDPEVGRRFTDAMTGLYRACTAHGVTIDLSD